MAKILKCAGNDDIVTLTASPDEDKLNFLFEPSGGSNERVSRFSLMLMDIDSEHLGIPDTEYTCEITMPSVEFQRICREVTVLGDTCKIEVNKDRVAFSAQGDMGEGHIVLSVDEAADKKAALKLNVAESVEQSFALRYLNAFTKATPLCDTVKLQLSANVPLVVEYGVPKPTADDGEGKKKKKSEDDEDDDEDIEYTGDLKYFLAPKIEDEE